MLGIDRYKKRLIVKNTQRLSSFCVHGVQETLGDFSLSVAFLSSTRGVGTK